jgi:hypothetical protein
VQALRDRLGRAAQKLADVPHADVTADRDGVLARLPILSRWITLRRAALDSGNAAAFRDRLASAEQYVRLETDDAATAIEALEAVEHALQVGPDLAAEIEAVARAVEEWRSAPHVVDITDPSSSIAASISRAKQALDAGDTDAAAAARTDAWRTWLEAAADELRQLLDGGPPPEVAADDWQRLREDLSGLPARVRLANDAGSAMTSYREAYARYLEVAAAGLAGLKDGAERDRRRLIRERATLAVERARAQRVGEAYAVYREATEGHAKLAGRMGDGDGGRAAAVPPPDAHAPVSQVTVPPAPTIFPPADRISRQIRSWELVAAIAIGALLALSGLLLIYQADPSWGGWADAAALFLWGLGLYQIGNIAGLSTIQATGDRIAGTDRSGG